MFKLIFLLIFINGFLEVTVNSNFITINFHQNKSKGNEFIENQRANERSFDLYESPERRRYYLNGYTLRYYPHQLKPKLFWNKFPIKQQEPPMENTTMDPDKPMNTDLPNVPSTVEPPKQTTIMSETNTVEMTDFPSSEMPPVMNTTMTTKPTKRPTFRPSTTQTSIMRPISRPPATKLKNFLLFGSPFEANFISQRTSGPRPKGKGFLNIFEVIKFENSKCSVSMDNVRTMDGVCYHDFECKSLGGISTEACAEGVGVCCICCGDATNQAITYFESPNYPNAVHEMMMCVLVVNLRKNVQQLRLDFLMFELNRPTDGDCDDDQFIVSGHNLNFDVPILCGINTGQHIYVHVGDSFERKIYLTFVSKTVTEGRAFNIRIAQMEDDLAPANCLQYFREANGIVKSFNYDVEGLVIATKQPTYLNNLNYAICFNRLKEMCSISYSVEQISDSPLDFQILNKDEGENDLVPDGQAGAGIFNCPDDYIGINQVRLCGERLNDGTDIEDFNSHAVIRDLQAGPFILPVKTDSEYVGRGFRLVYHQDSCT